MILPIEEENPIGLLDSVALYRGPLLDLFTLLEESWKNPAPACPLFTIEREHNKVTVYASTGCNESNEQIINALTCNFKAWNASWHTVQRGGHYVFIFKKDDKI